MTVQHQLCLFMACLVFPLLAACQTQEGEPQVGGESHWLTSCTASHLCPGDSLCICGVCTLPCDDQNACEGQNDTCAPSNGTCDVQACQSTCDEDTPCASGTVCVDGTCQSDANWQCDGTQRTTTLESGATLISGPRETQETDNCVALDAGSGVHCNSDMAIVDAVVFEEEVTFKICSTSQPAQQTLQSNEDALTITPSEGGVFAIQDSLTLPNGLQLQAPRLTLRGEGQDPTLHADLTLRASNARLRQLTVDGDVQIQNSSNGTALVDLHIKGSLYIQANNVALIRVTIDGDLLIEGNNATILAVDVQGATTWGNNTTCDDTAPTNENAQPSLCPPQ